MEEQIRKAVDVVVPIVEAIGALVIVVGVLVSFAYWVAAELRIHATTYEQVRLRLARYLTLGLEFQLGADVLGTAVSPSFEEIGRLGAIATIRTVLNYSLQRDLEKIRAGEQEDPKPGAR